jgi:hypothetical protein
MNGSRFLFACLFVLSILCGVRESNGEPVTIALGAAAVVGTSVATGIPISTLMMMALSSLGAAVGISSLSWNVYNTVSTKRENKKKEEMKEAMENWNQEFTCVSFSMEPNTGNYSNIVIPLMLIINRDHREIRKIFCSVNNCEPPTQQELEACPYGVDKLKNPVDDKQLLQNLPIPIRIKQNESFYPTTVNMSLPAPGVMLWLTPNLFVKIDATNTNIFFNYNSNEEGRRDWTELYQKLNYIYGDHKDPVDDRLQRMKNFLNGTIEGDRGAISKLPTPNTRVQRVFPQPLPKPAAQPTPPKPPNIFKRGLSACWRFLCCVGRKIESMCCCSCNKRPINIGYKMAKLKE